MIGGAFQRTSVQPAQVAQVKAERQDSTLTACLTGRIDASNALEFENAITSNITEGDRAVILDFENLTYISSSGLRIVLTTAKTLWKRDAKFALWTGTRPAGRGDKPVDNAGALPTAYSRTSRPRTPQDQQYRFQRREDQETEAAPRLAHTQNVRHYGANLNADSAQSSASLPVQAHFGIGLD